MIDKVRGVNNLSFKAHFVDDDNGNLDFLYNKSRGLLNKNELDTFTKILPNHAIEIQNINLNKDRHITGVNLFNHNSGEFKYVDTSDVANIAVLNKVIKNLNSIYKESKRFHGDDDYEKIFGSQRGFFNTNSYYSILYNEGLKNRK